MLLLDDVSIVEKLWWAIQLGSDKFPYSKGAIIGFYLPGMAEVADFPVPVFNVSIGTIEDEDIVALDIRMVYIIRV